MLDDSLADTQQYHAADAFGFLLRGVASPPLVPFSPNPAQWRFMRLHAFKNVTKWQWHFQETILRAHADNGDVATVSAGDLEEMLLAGVMSPGAGIADVSLTMTGMEMCV